MAIITPALSAPEIETVAELAQLIWNEHYSSIISQQQIDYMLESFQSATAIQKQIADKALYFLISSNNGKPVGYLALLPDESNGRVQISKIYVDAAHRGLGYGKRSLIFIEELCRQAHIQKAWLTVNKHNSIAINAYRRWGFHTTGSIVTPIGKGFVMDDFTMEKELFL